MKFAKCMYASFGNSILGVQWTKGDVFAVTEEISQSQVYIDGVNTRNFIPVDITTLPQLRKVVNLTSEMEGDFIDELAASNEPEEVPEETPPVAPPEGEGSDVHEEEKTDVDDGEAELPEIAFTRSAGNVTKAVKAIRECEDLRLLKHAKTDDTRKTVQSALKIRIDELEK